MDTLPLRLPPGADLRRALEAALAGQGVTAAFVIAGIGSLSVARLRRAGAPAADTLAGPLEILTLAGTLAPEGAHLHMSVASASGAVQGGHVAAGCTVRTTAEVLLAWLPGWSFARVHDPATGYGELAVRLRP
jgi:predicted DNA-binding protein with PD1-like motif